MTFRDYSSALWQMQKEKAKRAIKRKLWPILVPILAILMLILVVTGGGGGAASAEEWDYSSMGGIYGNTVEEKVWFTLRGAGYSEYAVAGVMGNIYAESEFDSNLIEKGNGIGFGLCQWSYGRRTQYEKYAKSKGVSPSDVDTQIEFLLAEITPGGGANGYATYQLMNYKGYKPADWKNATSPENAAIAFCWTFERPGVPRMNVRTTAARKYYEQFKGKVAPVGGTGQYVKVTAGGKGVKGTFSYGGKLFKLYAQGAFRDVKFAGGTISANGCGVTSASIILSAYDSSVTPVTMAREVNSKYIDKLVQAFTRRGLKVEQHNRISYSQTDKARIINHLRSGGQVFVLLNPGSSVYNIYSGGHYITFLGVNSNGEVFMGDPGTYNSPNDGWINLDRVGGRIRSYVLVGK